jgi:phage-related protein
VASKDAFYSAYVELLPDGSKLGKQSAKLFDDVGVDGGKRAGKGFNAGIVGGIGSLAAPIAGAFAAMGIGSIIKDSIGNASDFSESGTAITAVFGDADKTIQDFAANAATSLGQSTNMTLDAARVFGTFGKAAGLGGEDLAGFSTDFIGLAGDLASFNNTTPEQAIEALGAGLRGESEPLRQYGVLLDDAALKARATELGIYSGTGALTQQQKVLAAQAEIMAQTSTQQGDFAKTSGGLANQQRILSAGLENLSTSFGALLLPAMLGVVGFLNTAVIPALGNVVPAIQGIFDILVKGDFTTAFREAFGVEEDSKLVDFLFDVREGFQAFSAVVGPILSEVGAVLGGIFRDLGAAIGPMIPDIIEFVSAFSVIGIAFKAIGPLLPDLLSAFGGLAMMLGGALGTALTTLLPAVQSLSTILITVLGQVIAALLPVLTQLVGILGPLLTTVLNAIMPIIVLVAGVIGQLLTAVAPLVTTVLALVAPLVQLVASILGPLIELFAAMITPIVSLVGTLIDLLLPAINGIVTGLTAVVTGITSAIQWFVDLVTGAGTAGADLTAFFSGLPQTILDSLGDMGSFLLDAGKDLMGGFIDGITGAVDGIGDAVGGAMDWVGGFFPHSPAKRGPFAGSGWKAVKDAGLAIGDQFGVGLTSAEPGLNAQLGSMLATPVSPTLEASVYGASSGGGSGRSGVDFTQVNNYADGLSESDVSRLNAEKMTYALRGI